MANTPLSRKAGSEEQVGDIKQSILTEAQFQTLHGPTWILFDDRSIVGSDLNTLFGFTTLADARGQFLRGKNNGRGDGQQNPDGDLALGAQTSDKFQNHNHTLGVTSNPGGTPGTYGATGGPQSFVFGYIGGANGNASNETAPKCLTVNTFIKINKE